MSRSRPSPVAQCYSKPLQSGISHPYFYFKSCPRVNNEFCLSRSTGESDSGKVCIIHKHGRANYGTIQTLTIKRWEKIQEIKDIRSNAENEREQQTLICERIPPVVDFAQHGYHHFCYNSFINTRNIKRKVSLEPEYEEWCSKSKRIKTNASSVLFPVQCIFCDKKTLWISQKTGKRKEDRLVKCVTKTAETSIKESVVRKGDERLKEHLENADLIAKEAWYHEFCRKGNWPIMDMYEGIITYKN